MVTMCGNLRFIMVVTALLMLIVMGSLDDGYAKEKPRLPRPLVLKLNLERVGPPSLPEPRILTINISREQEKTASQTKLTQDSITRENSEGVSPEDYEACLALAKTYTEKCDEIAARWGELDCQRSGRQSGCLCWKVSCFSPYTPAQVFSCANCSKPGFYRCADAIYANYVACVDSCNTAKDRVKCLNERCHAQAKIAFSRCDIVKTPESAWREPTGGSPEAQPGSDENVMAALAKEATARESSLTTASSTGNQGGMVEQGRIAILRDGRQVPVAQGAPFPFNVPIVANSPTTVVLPDGSRVKIGPMGMFTYDDELHALMPKSGTFHIDHAADAKLNRAWRSIKDGARATVKFLRVIAAGIKIGMLGTNFIVETDPDRQIDRVLVREGEVEVEGTVSGRARLSAGQMAIARDGVLEGTSAMPDDTWAAALQSLDSGGVAGGIPATGSQPTGDSAIETAPDADGCAGIKGRWRWFNGVMVECFADGRCEASNGFGGPWKCLDASGRFEIQWSRPGQQKPYVDTLNISSDGWALKGVNQSGQGVGGHRPEFTTGDPQTGRQAIFGKWRWSNGALVECKPDNTCTSSNGFTGHWRCINDKGRFEIRWSQGGRPDQFIDTLVISPLGSYLTGKNQYGVAIGAVRE